jgi:ABC-type polysaccharide/polyol phosphate export permease
VSETNVTTAAQPHHRENDFAEEHHVYEPHLVGLPPLLPYIREAWRRRSFAVELSRTKLRAAHFNTIFGQLWLVLNPLLLAGIYFVLVDILRGGSNRPGFFAHLVAGIFAYHLVSDAARDGTKSVVSGGRLILNTAFPRVLLPLASVVSATKRFLPTLVIYVPVHLASGLPIDPELLWVIPLLALLVVLASGLAMIVGAAQVYFRDLKNLMPYLLRIWLFASPVLYFAEEMPDKYRFLLNVNPLGQLLAAWSDAINLGRTPSAQSLLVGTAWAVGLLVAGFVFFISREREFAVRL